VDRPELIAVEVTRQQDDSYLIKASLDAPAQPCILEGDIELSTGLQSQASGPLRTMRRQPRTNDGTGWPESGGAPFWALGHKHRGDEGCTDQPRVLSDARCHAFWEPQESSVCSPLLQVTLYRPWCRTIR